MYTIISRMLTGVMELVVPELSIDAQVDIIYRLYSVHVNEFEFD